MKIKIYGLRLFFRYFGYIGVPWTELCWKHWKLLVWNLALNVLICWMFVGMFRYAQIHKRYHAAEVSGNMFGYVVDYIAGRAFFCTYLLTLAYLLLFGHRLMTIMDYSLFIPVFSDDSNHRLLSWIFLLFVNLFGVLYYLAYGSVDLTPQIPSFMSLARFYTCYLVNMVNEFGLIFTHYFKYGTLQVLKRLLAEVQQSRVTELQARKTIQKLAAANRQFHLHVAFLLVLFICRETIYGTMGLFLLHGNALSPGFIIMFSIHLMHGWYLTIVDDRIQKMLADLARHLKGPHHYVRQPSVRATTDVQAMIRSCYELMLVGQLTENDVRPLRNRLNQLFQYRPHRKPNNSETRHSEIVDVYHQDFQMNLFSLLVMNRRFLMQDSAFIFLNFVLIMQTATNK